MFNDVSRVFVRERREKNPCGTIACVENKTIVILILISHIWERNKHKNNSRRKTEWKSLKSVRTTWYFINFYDEKNGF
jgi:hypothetical protein